MPADGGSELTEVASLPRMRVGVGSTSVIVDPARDDVAFVDLNDGLVSVCVDLAYLDPGMGVEWRSMPEPFVQIRLSDDGYASDQVVLAEIPLHVLARSEPGDRDWMPAGIRASNSS